MNSWRQERKTNEASKIVGRVITGVDRGSSLIIKYQQKLEGLGGLNGYEKKKEIKFLTKLLNIEEIKVTHIASMKELE
ncbi:hypothetical protein QUA82_29380 [Microcoleus sp. F8-D3]